MGTLCEYQCTFFITSHSFLFRMGTVSDTSYREYKNIHFTFNKFFFLNHAVYEIMWKNVVEPGRPQMTICGLRVACWVTKATKTQS